MSQQVGSSLGVALLNTIYATAVASYLMAHGTGPVASLQAPVHGYTVGFWVSTAVLGAAALVALVVIRAKRSQLQPEPELALAPVG